jgi:hypothetical protein
MADFACNLFSFIGIEQEPEKSMFSWSGLRGSGWFFPV